MSQPRWLDFTRGDPGPAEIAGLRFWLAGVRLQALLRKANFNPGQLRDEIGRWLGDGGSGRAEPAQGRRRSGFGLGTPAQQTRLAIAQSRAQTATRRVQELQPGWKAPQSLQSNPPGIEGSIAQQEAVAGAAEARLAEILRDAIPNTNPSWGISRLRKELYDQGYILAKPTRSPGLMYENPDTGEQVRIMERPSRSFRADSVQKHFNDYYYRYRSNDNQPFGSHITIPNKGDGKME